MRLLCYANEEWKAWKWQMWEDVESLASATLTDDVRDSHPLITPRLMHLTSPDSKSLFTVTQRRSPQLMMFYIFMEALFSCHSEFVKNGAVLGKPEVPPGSHISLFIRRAAAINAVTHCDFWWGKWTNRLLKSAFADTNWELFRAWTHPVPSFYLKTRWGWCDKSVMKPCDWWHIQWLSTDYPNVKVHHAAKIRWAEELERLMATCLLLLAAEFINSSAESCSTGSGQEVSASSGSLW